jgi:hypothetical protein
LSKAVRELQENNRALQEEIAAVRSGRSSYASVSRASSRADGGKRMVTGHESGKEDERNERRKSEQEEAEAKKDEMERTEDVAGETGMRQQQGRPRKDIEETPLSRKWVEMDEVQFPQRNSPRMVLEAVLEGKRQQRLAQAGLAYSENTAIPPRPQSDREPKFADLTFTHGNTLKAQEKSANWTYDRWKNWPGTTKIPGGRIAYNAEPIVNVMRELPNASGRYMVSTEMGDTIYAEIRTDENPQFDHSDENPPETPPGWVGDWFITAEETPRWEFIGEHAPPKQQTRQPVQPGDQQFPQGKEDAREADHLRIRTTLTTHRTMTVEEDDGHLEGPRSSARIATAGTGAQKPDEVTVISRKGRRQSSTRESKSCRPKLWAHLTQTSTQ